jgi:hypothetical protein
MGSASGDSAKWREIIANTGDNWPDYKLLVEGWALKNDSIDIMRGKSDMADYTKKRHDLYFLLISTQSDKTRHLLRTVDPGDAETAWKRLREHFESTTKASIKQQLKTMMNLRQGTKTVPEFISSVQECHRRVEAAIKETNVNILDLLLQSVLIDGLDTKYTALQQALMLDDTLTNDGCVAQMLEATQRIDFNNGGGTSRTTRQIEGTTAYTCSVCHTDRHTNAECWRQHPEKRPQRNDKKAPDKRKIARATAFQNWRVSVVNSSSIQANAVKAANTPNNAVTFIMDSGAMKHFTNTTEGLVNFNPEKKFTVELADQSRITAEGTGSFGNKLPEVIYSPKFGTPLLSIHQLYLDGKATIFHPTQGIIVTDAKNMDVRIKGTPHIRGKLTEHGFEAQIHVDPVSARPAKVIQGPALKGNDPRLWMMRLGFPSAHRILSAAQDKLVTGMPIPASARPEDFIIRDMDDYYLGKSKSRPHRMKPPGSKDATQPFEQLHLDIKVTNVTTRGGNKYLLVITDNFTRWKDAIPMKRKGDTADTFKNWYLLFVKNLGFTTRRIRCDNAKENISLKGFARAHSIRIQFSNKYSSQSNGLAERSIGMLTSTIRTLLQAGNLPQTFWGEAALTAAYLLNRLPTTANPNSKTPYEMVYGRPPDIRHLRTFGCRAYVHLKKQERDVATFAATAKKGICVGYAMETNGYRIAYEDGTTEETAEVKFDETTFPGVPTPQGEPEGIFQLMDDDEDTNEEIQSTTAPVSTPEPTVVINVEGSEKSPTPTTGQESETSNSNGQARPVYTFF